MLKCQMVPDIRCLLLELIKGFGYKRCFEAHVILPNDGVLVGALKEVGAKVRKSW